VSGYDNTNTFVLFKNKDKATEKHPDYKGTLNINGVEHWASSWIKTSKNGEKFMSGSITPKNANNTRAPVQSKSAPADDFGDSEVPF
jgi:uncharacterized protein (DUF736 family)